MSATTTCTVALGLVSDTMVLGLVRRCASAQDQLALRRQQSQRVPCHIRLFTPYSWRLGSPICGEVGNSQRRRVGSKVSASQRRCQQAKVVSTRKRGCARFHIPRWSGRSRGRLVNRKPMQMRRREHEHEREVREAAGMCWFVKHRHRPACWYHACQAMISRAACV
jgi:hypothetical protein